MGSTEVGLSLVFYYLTLVVVNGLECESLITEVVESKDSRLVFEIHALNWLTCLWPLGIG